MPYIPEQHRKYDLLPWKQEHGGEVFEYPSILSKVTELLPEGETLDPYGYESYRQYYDDIDAAAEKYAKTEQDRELFSRYKAAVIELNQKENWSVLRYIGKSDDGAFGLKHGHVYYWPTSKNHPVYHGVIDEEEYTAYLHPTDPNDWEILEDPTGMAYNTLHGITKGGCSREQFDHLMKQVREMLSE